jgi:flagellar basal-body rod modification protein FlgD
MISQLSATPSPDTSSTSSSKSSTAATDSLANTDTFLKLLVAQLQNQDPLNPSDSMQFVSQLAQFSELEQVIAIRSDVDTLNSTTAASTSDSSSGTSTSKA